MDGAAAGPTKALVIPVMEGEVVQAMGEEVFLAMEGRVSLAMEDIGHSLKQMMFKIATQGTSMKLIFLIWTNVMAI